MTSPTLNLSDKNKAIIVNFVIIGIGLLIAFNIYKKQAVEKEGLVKQKEAEIKKSDVLKSIEALAGDVGTVKTEINKKDPQMLINNLTNIAKNNGVKVNSIRPRKEEDSQAYVKYPYALSITADNYGQLAKFILALENSADVYVIESLAIKKGVVGMQSGPKETEEESKPTVSAEVTVSTIFIKD